MFINKGENKGFTLKCYTEIPTYVYFFHFWQHWLNEIFLNLARHDDGPLRGQTTYHLVDVYIYDITAVGAGISMNSHCTQFFCTFSHLQSVFSQQEWCLGYCKIVTY